MKTFADIGTQLKLALALQCGSLSGSDFDFKCRFFTFMGGISIEMGKADMIEQDGAYIAVINTKWMTAGELSVSVRAEIPDTDAPGGTRIEMATVPTDIVLKRR